MKIQAQRVINRERDKKRTLKVPQPAPHAERCRMVNHQQLRAHVHGASTATPRVAFHVGFRRRSSARRAGSNNAVLLAAAESGLPTSAGTDAIGCVSCAGRLL